MPNHQVSLQCPTTKYPCSAQPQSILTLPNCKVSLQCSTTKYPRSDQLQSIPAVPNRRVSLERPTAEYQDSCSAFAVLQGRQLRGGRETLHFLCNIGFTVRMLEENNSLDAPAYSCGHLVRSVPRSNALCWGFGFWWSKDEGSKFGRDTTPQNLGVLLHRIPQHLCAIPNTGVAWSR